MDPMVRLSSKASRPRLVLWWGDTILGMVLLQGSVEFA